MGAVDADHLSPVGGAAGARQRVAGSDARPSRARPRAGPCARQLERGDRQPTAWSRPAVARLRRSADQARALPVYAGWHVLAPLPLHVATVLVLDGIGGDVAALDRPGPRTRSLARSRHRHLAATWRAPPAWAIRPVFRSTTVPRSATCPKRAARTRVASARPCALSVFATPTFAAASGAVASKPRGSWLSAPFAPASFLNSFFAGQGDESASTRALRGAVLQKLDSRRPTFFVTHQVNITALTGIVPAEGEAIFVRATAAGTIEVVGRARLR